MDAIVHGHSREETNPNICLIYSPLFLFIFLFVSCSLRYALLLDNAYNYLYYSLKAANEPESSVTMVVVLAAPGALLIAIIGLAAILAIYHRQRKRNLRQHQSSQHTQSVVQTRDIEDVDTTVNYSQTKNNKQPDLIKSKRGIPVACIVCCRLTNLVKQKKFQNLNISWPAHQMSRCIRRLLLPQTIVTEVDSTKDRQ